jgi:hypothetical protein
MGALELTRLHSARPPILVLSHQARGHMRCGCGSSDRPEALRSLCLEAPRHVRRLE